MSTIIVSSSARIQKMDGEQEDSDTHVRALRQMLSIFDMKRKRGGAVGSGEGGNACLGNGKGEKLIRGRLDLLDESQSRWQVATHEDSTTTYLTPLGRFIRWSFVVLVMVLVHMCAAGYAIAQLSNLEGQTLDWLITAGDALAELCPQLQFLTSNLLGQVLPNEHGFDIPRPSPIIRYLLDVSKHVNMRQARACRSSELWSRLLAQTAVALQLYDSHLGANSLPSTLFVLLSMDMYLVSKFVKWRMRMRRRT